MLTHLREPVSGLTHYFAAIAAVIGLVVLILLAADDATRQRTLLVYGASLVLMLIASASYHLIQDRPARMRFLRKLDHSAIYIFIAGTYTPICTIRFEGFWQWGMPAVVWALAIAGTLVKLFVIRGPRWLTAGLYLVLGWLSVLALREIVQVLPPGGVFWLVAGGVVFTLGAVVYITKILDFAPGVFGFHEAWHLFVLGGSLCHYILIAVYVAPYVRPA